jgi:hypothetical protein
VTVEDVQRAKEALEAQYEYPSAERVVAWLQQYGTPATRRVVLRHLHTLGGARGGVGCADGSSPLRAGA